MSAPAYTDERCKVALHAVHELATLIDAIAPISNRVELEDGAVLMAIVVRARQLSTVASTMLGDAGESVTDNMAIASPMNDIKMRPGRPNRRPECNGSCSCTNTSAVVPCHGR